MMGRNHGWRNLKIHRAMVGAAVALLALAGAASAQQQILLDKPVRAGELILFPDLNDANAYYYVVDKPKLATDANGKPQFSFLRYVENVAGTGGADAPREGEGGGIVHAVFPSRRGLLPSVRGFIDFLAAEYERFRKAEPKGRYGCSTFCSTTAPICASCPGRDAGCG